MKKYQVKVKEILERVIEIEAENREKAIDIVNDMYRNQDIILDSEDYKETKIY